MPTDANKITIKKFDNGAWWFTRTDGQQFQVSSINDHCTEKLQALLDSGDQAYITLEEIVEYPSEEYRCKVSRMPGRGWDDEDVACLVENQTGNLNPNAERDIAAATARMKEMNIL